MSTRTNNLAGRARRVTVTFRSDGRWHYTAQARNWRTLATSKSEGYATEGAAKAAARKEFPGVELVVEP